MKKKWMIYGIIGVFITTAGIGCVVSARSGKIKLPYSSQSVVGENVDGVKEQLEQAGFQNVEVISSTSGWFHDHEILNMSVDSQTAFRSGSYHKPEEAIVITYSSDDRMDAKTALNGWESMKYKAYYDTLINAGFTNVSTVELETEEYSLNHRIASVNVNGEDYVNGSCYLPSDAPIIISYYKAQLEIGHSREEYLGANYKKVVAELEEKGFSDIETEPVVGGWGEENAVVDITIGSAEAFARSDTFSYDEKIRIRYNSDNREDVTAILKDYHTHMYQDLKVQLIKQGFSNMKFEGIETNDKSKNQMTAEVTVEGEPFREGECYVDKNAEIIVKYYTLTITMPESASSYIRNYKNDYKALEEELRKAGFVNIEVRGSRDLITGWLNKEGSVKSVSIDGEEKFDKGDGYLYEAPIVITVNTYKEKRGRFYSDL